MPAPSPRRPRPPARSSGKTGAHSIHHEGCSDDEDPLSMSFTSPEVEVPRPPPKTLSPAPSRVKAVGRLENSSKSSRIQRRRTLDQELRDAKGGSAAEEDTNFEDSVFIGVGTRKRRGFLAHGGAGGGSVFMGVGYVEGVEEEGGTEGEISSDEYQPEKAKVPKRRTKR